MSGYCVCVRPALPQDAGDIEDLLLTVFPSADEAQRHALARRSGHIRHEFVATNIQNMVVGVIALVPVWHERIGPNPVALGLVPLAVNPDWQGQGVGTALMWSALHAARGQAKVVVVLGNPTYYGRFGFRPASQWLWESQYQAGNAFQAMVLEEPLEDIPPGLLVYAPAWRV